MIQDVMIFALGFLGAGLLSLLALPIVSRRAQRLATHRLSMLVPMSMREIVAERDQIRAEHAAETRRLEQKVEHLTLTRAEAMAEAGRHAARFAAAAEARDSLARRAAMLEGELASATAAAHDATAELGLQMQLLHDTLGLAERRLAILHTTEAQRTANEALADGQRLTIAGLETRATGQDLRIRGLMAQLASAAEDLRLLQQRALLAETERDRFLRERDAAQNETAVLRTRLWEKDNAVEAVDEQDAEAAADFAALRHLLVELAARSDTAIDWPESDETPATLRRAISSVAADLYRSTQAPIPLRIENDTAGAMPSRKTPSVVDTGTDAL